jgi:hypothetical protein
MCLLFPEQFFLLVAVSHLAVTVTTADHFDQAVDILLNCRGMQDLSIDTANYLARHYTRNLEYRPR